MSKSAHLTLRPDRCNQCGKCIAACPNSAVRIGESYILIDWHVCQQCYGCVEACDTRAIQREVMALRSTPIPTAVAPGDVGKVVVGSRAEAKAVRRVAEQAARQAGRGGARPAIPRAAVIPISANVAATGDSDAAVSAGAFAPLDRSRSTSGQSSHSHGAPNTAAPIGAASWTLVDAAAVLAVLLLTIVGKNAVFAIPALALMPPAGKIAARAGVLAVYYGVQIGALVFLARRHSTTLMSAFSLRRDPEEDESDKTLSRPSVIGSLGLVAACLVVTEVVALVYLAAVHANPPATDLGSVFGEGGVGIVLSAVFVAMIAPLAEELAFRGVVLGAVADRWGMWPGIAVSAAFFAVYHFNVWLFFPMLVLGGALGWLALSRRSLWPPIMLHVLYNGLAVALALLVKPGGL